MSDLICQLKLPAVVLSVLTIVWSLSQVGGTDDHRYFPPIDPAAEKRAIELNQQALARYPEPIFAALGLD